ncbi:LacI family DNA-binding transcriptional regulator [Granulosicoccus sp. 3-233]|uniref:LacI family DNA-binding transcriptional regulator n=1 Tax=Granulosicoccus sp. 3-233 TaxID=3417969 RepID=UPI003D350AAB
MGKSKSKTLPAIANTGLRMQDIADAAGVSKMTVSRALRNDEYVSARTRARIQAVIDRMGYVPDQNAAGFATGRSGFVATLIPSIEHSIFASTLRGITDILGEQGLLPLLGDTDYRLDREELLIETLLKRRPEGMIVTGGKHTERARKLLQHAGIPVVEMWDVPEQPIADSVGFSNHEAGRTMARHLKDRGYRNLAFIGAAAGDDTRGAARRQGFLDAVIELGLNPARVVTFDKPPITTEQGGQAMTQLLNQSPEVDAVFCVSDPSAVGAIMQCHRLGLRVPDDIAIAGFGDFEIARASFPSITTISCDWRALGEAAARQIIERLKAGDKTLSVSTTLMTFSLVHREST